MFQIIQDSYKLNEKNELYKISLQLKINSKLNLDLFFNKELKYEIDYSELFNESIKSIEDLSLDELSNEDLIKDKNKNIIDDNKVDQVYTDKIEYEYLKSFFEFKNNKFCSIAFKIATIPISAPFGCVSSKLNPDDDSISRIASYIIDSSSGVLINSFSLETESSIQATNNLLKFSDLYFIYIFDITDYNNIGNIGTNDEILLEEQNNGFENFYEIFDENIFDNFKVVNNSFVVSLKDKSNTIFNLEMSYRPIGESKITEVPSLFGEIYYKNRDCYIFIILQKDFPSVYKYFKEGLITIFPNNRYQKNLQISSEIKFLKIISEDSMFIYTEKIS